MEVKKRMDFPMLYQISAEAENLTDEWDGIILRAKDGDVEAFGVIFEHNYRFIYKFIFALTGEQNSAEEMTQEVFLGAFKNIHSLRGDAKLQTWLCGIAKNIVYKSFRSNRIKEDETVEQLNISDEKNPLPDRQFLSKELNRKIHSALKKLDGDKRLVFTLKELQNLSYKEISEITGYRIPKLKTDLRRAKIEMRKMLRPYVEVKK
ncbi:MAG: RNA polymerase sigma factor [Aridibacter sp.]